jgi:BirA family biotin operon repressor/biotin-[acetyl-CoA-carboxylase] ligase
VRVRLEQATLDGRFCDLDGDGALLLDLPEGRRRIAAGEIFPALAG